jgi:transcription antitermination factor NusG
MTYWVAVEMNHMGETETDIEKIRKEVHRHLPGVDVFIPSHTYKRDGKIYNKVLLDGYIFVNGIDDFKKLFKLENTNFFKQVLTSTKVDENSGHRVRSPTKIRDSEIEKMRTKMALMYKVGIRDGDTVLITEGLYKDLQATALEVRKDTILCKVDLRSLETIREIPKLFVEKV